MNWAVELRELSKEFSGGKRAVDSVSVRLEPGQVFGFLGPNGAGKTTTVKLLTGMLSPSGGGCSVFGIDPAAEPEQAHALSGVVTEHAQMYDNLTCLDNLLFYGALFGLESAACRQRAQTLLEQLDLRDAAEKKLGAYSTGMRQRLSLARAMMHQPKVLFLDEPTSGLDPESAQNVHRMIRSLAEEQGVTVFLCTHQLRYAQEVCTCYGLMDQGRLLAQGTLAQLRAQVSQGVRVEARASRVPPEAGWRQIEPGRYAVQVESEEAVPQMVRDIVSCGGDLYHISAAPPSLEEVYFALTERKEATA